MKPKYILALLILLIGVGVAGYFGYEFYTVDMVEMDKEIQIHESELATLNNELNQLKKFAENLDRMKQEFKELNFQLQSALELMPRQFDLGGLLRRLNSIAENSGIEIISFRPRKSEEKIEGQFYSSTVIDMNIKGAFTQSLLFFDQLARIKRIVNIESIKFSASHGVSGPRVGATLAEATSTIRTYRFSE